MSLLRTHFTTAVTKGAETPEIDINTLNCYPRQYDKIHFNKKNCYLQVDILINNTLKKFLMMFFQYIETTFHQFELMTN